MPLIPLQLPPGVYRNGTDLQAANRWRDASLVRWVDGTMQPVGGWLTRVAMTDKPLRGALAWRDLSNNRWFASGSYEKLFVGSANNTITDITPAGLVVGTADSTVNLGYGGSFYGTAAYGIARPDDSQSLPATTWSLDNWGETLVACSDKDGQLLQWSLNTATDAVAISGAPTNCDALVVTAERFLFALGAGGNYRKVQWSDRENITDWTPTATNEAGDIELQTVSQIMLGIRTRGQTLILTDSDAHAATYQGPPYVYGFERVGSACGAVSRLCAAAVDAGVFWMGQRGFFMYGGGAVQPIPSEVADYVFSNMNFNQRSKVAAVPNAKFSEIWWFYPSMDSTENDSYVVFNYRENHWSIGELARTSGVDAGVFTTPIWMTPTGTPVNHEIGHYMGGAVAYAESGPIQIGAGDTTMSVVELIPDERTQGQATTTFKTRFYPNDTERTYGPYSMANPTSTRFTGRQISLRVTGEDNTDWRWGVPRIDARPGSAR